MSNLWRKESFTLPASNHRHEKWHGSREWSAQEEEDPPHRDTAERKICVKNSVSTPFEERRWAHLTVGDGTKTPRSRLEAQAQVRHAASGYTFLLISFKYGGLCRIFGLVRSSLTCVLDMWSAAIYAEQQRLTRPPRKLASLSLSLSGPAMDPELSKNERKKNSNMSSFPLLWGSQDYMSYLSKIEFTVHLARLLLTHSLSFHQGWLPVLSGAWWWPFYNLKNVAMYP